MAKKILFLCGHNSGRSQMAQALFNNLNKNKEFIGISAGTNPGESISKINIKVMQEIGIDISDENEYYPKKFNIDELGSIGRIYTMGCNVTCDLPQGRKFDADWELKDPADKPIEKIREIRDQIRAKVTSLIEELTLKEINDIK